MFNFKNIINKTPGTENQPSANLGLKNDTEVSPEDILKEVENQTQDNFDVDQVKVHAMPDKFLAENGAVGQPPLSVGDKKITNFKKNIILGIIIGVIVIGLLSLAGWFLLKSIKTPTTNLTANEEVFNQPRSAESPAVIPPVSETPTLCSAENCRACLEQECLNLPDDCHLEDLCQLESYGGGENCPDYLCVAGAKPETENQEDLENGEGTELQSAKDSDNDLLTDVEEGIWGTDPLVSDTDKDGYGDGQELKSLYNPLVANQKLSGSNLIKTFTNTHYGYAVYYPANWVKSTTTTEADDQVMFISNTNEFIQTIVQENSSGFLTAKDWYLAQNPTADSNTIEEILIGNSSGVKSPDKLNVYLVNNKYIFSLTYNIGLKTELNYLTTFETITNSFQIFQTPL